MELGQELVSLMLRGKVSIRIGGMNTMVVTVSVMVTVTVTSMYGSVYGYIYSCRYGCGYIYGDG